MFCMAAVLAAAAVLAGCQQPKPPPPPPPAVTVTQPVKREVIEWDEYTGNLAAPEMVNLAARVSGFIVRADFEEGALVHAGDLLFVIDDRPFKADLDSKAAAVAQAQSLMDQSKVHYDRYAKVRGTQAISEDDFDAAKASFAQAEAALEVAKAAVVTAQLNLEWCRVTAPITGRISRKYVTVGNLVNGGAGQATQLTTIVSTDPLYCYVNIPGRAFLNYQALARLEKSENLRGGKVPCFIGLENETGFPHEGVIDFLDNQVDPGTGTLQIRGVFKNADGMLTPGLYARLSIPGSGRYETTLIPDIAIGTDQAERYVLMVDDKNMVLRRRVRLGALFGTMRSIPEGLALSDRVIINGMVHAFPGAPVLPIEAPPSADNVDITGGVDSPTTQELPATRPTTQPLSLQTR